MSLTSLLALIILVSTVFDASNIPLTIESLISYPIFLKLPVISLLKTNNFFLASSLILTISFLTMKLQVVLKKSDTKSKIQLLMEY